MSSLRPPNRSNGPTRPDVPKSTSPAPHRHRMVSPRVRVLAGAVAMILGLTMMATAFATMYGRADRSAAAPVADDSSKVQPSRTVHSWFGVVSYNLLATLPIATRMSDATRIANTKSVDVISWQEGMGAEPVFKGLHRFGWNTFQPKDSEVPISWRTSKFAFVKAWTTLMQYGMGKGSTAKPFPNRYVVTVVLRDRQTGENIAVMNTHVNQAIDNNGYPTKSDNARLANVHLQKLRTMVAKSTSAATVVTGDFNVDYRADSRVRYRGFPYAQLSPIAVSNWMKFGTNTQGSHGNRFIDYVWLKRKGLASMESQAVWGGGLHSDHRAVFVNLRLSVPVGQPTASQPATPSPSSHPTVVPTSTPRPTPTLTPIPTRHPTVQPQGPTRQKFGVVTYNTLFALGSKAHLDDQRTLAKNPAVDIIGWQEARTSAGTLPRLKSLGWGTYQPRVPGHSQATEVPISWRKSTFAFMSGRITLIHEGRNNGNPPPRCVVTVVLKNRATGQLVRVMNTHVNAYISNGGHPKPGIDTVNAIKHLRWLRNAVASSDTAVTLLTGDLNVDFRADQRVKAAGFPARVLQPVATNNWLKFGTKDVHPSHGNKSGSYIDYVWMKRGGKAVMTRQGVWPGGYHSDHHPVFVSMTLNPTFSTPPTYTTPPTPTGQPTHTGTHPTSTSSQPTNQPTTTQPTSEPTTQPTPSVTSAQPTVTSEQPPTSADAPDPTVSPTSATPTGDPAAPTAPTATLPSSTDPGSTTASASASTSPPSEPATVPDTQSATGEYGAPSSQSVFVPYVDDSTSAADQSGEPQTPLADTGANQVSPWLILAASFLVTFGLVLVIGGVVEGRRSGVRPVHG